MASEAQINYINSLAASKDLTHLDLTIHAYIKTPAALQQADNKLVNEILTALKAQPFKPRESENLEAKTELAKLEAATLAARYFIVDPSDNTEKFVKVNKPEPPSRWTGYTFIEVQGGDFFYSVKRTDSKLAILRAIQEDPTKAMNEYGIRLGVCGYCGRTLTNRDSRLRGLGPVCANRLLGQATPEQTSLLQRLGLIDK